MNLTMKRTILLILIALGALPVAAQQGEVCFAPDSLPKNVVRICLIKPDPKTKIEQTELEFINHKKLTELDPTQIEMVGVVIGTGLDIVPLPYSSGQALPALPDSVSTLWIVLKGSHPRYKQVRLAKDCKPNMFCIEFTSKD